MKKSKGAKKVAKVMREYKAGTLHSGKKGPVVKSRKQAVAIALSEAGMAKRKAKKK
jgi:ribosomal protein L21E